MNRYRIKLPVILFITKINKNWQMIKLLFKILNVYLIMLICDYHKNGILSTKHIDVYIKISSSLFLHELYKDFHKNLGFNWIGYLDAYFVVGKTVKWTCIYYLHMHTIDEFDVENSYKPFPNMYLFKTHLIDYVSVY